MDRRSLLHQLDIIYLQYDKLKDMLKHFPYRRTQVEYLSLQDCFRPDFDKRELCNTFPNLQEIKLIKLDCHDNETNYTSNEFHFTYPVSKLRYIADFGECELTRQLAMSNLCNRLKTLKLSLYVFSDPTKGLIIPHLYNMPVLEYLQLEDLRLRLTDLEMLSKNIPSLKTVEFVDVQLVTSKIPHSVEPAPLVTNLALYVVNVDDLQTHVQFYKYMGNKYPSVITLDISDSALRDEFPEYAMEVYNDGIFPLYQKVGSGMDKFVFENYCYGMDAFRKFDTFGMKLEELIIKSSEFDALYLQDLVESKQCKYLRKLGLGDPVPQSIELVAKLEVLELLSVNCHRYNDMTEEEEEDRTVNFSALIDACPKSLLALALDSVIFTFNDSTCNLTSINYLNLKPVELTQDLLNVIETSFPNLIGLSLCGLITTDLNISLPNHNIEEIEITALYKEDRRNGFSVKTNGKHQFFTLPPTDDTNGEQPTGDELVQVSKDEFKEPLIFNIVCASVNKLSLSAFEILKFEHIDYDDEEEEEEEGREGGREEDGGDE
jgi:hypothetical protein